MTRRRVVVAVVVALLLVGAGPVWHRVTTPAVVRDAAATLRTTSVVADDPAVLDAARVRQVIGDRPVVVAGLPAALGEEDRDARGDACHAVVRAVPEALAVVYTGSAGPYLCTGDDFPPPDEGVENALGSTTDNWVFRLSIAADAASRFRTTPDDPDRTPEVEELVLAFDAAVTEDMADGVPRREPAASATSTAVTLATLAGLVAAVVALLLGAQLGLARVRARRAAARSRRVRRLELESGLAAVAVAVLRAGDDLAAAASTRAGADPRALAAARARADVAGRYVLALADVEAAATEAELDAAQRTVATLRRDAAAVTETSLPVPGPVAATPRRRRRRRGRRREHA
ncbi:hypothetical protein GCM10027047_09790 [Rhodococcus aerolatus]